MNKKHYSSYYMILRRMLAVLTAAAVMMLAGCSGGNEAENCVRKDIESMRQIELDQETDDELKSMLSEQGREYLEKFLGKAGEFDYRITGSDKTGSGDDEAVIVHVRVTAYDFAGEYLKSWSEFLEGSGEMYDSAELYEILFRNLSNVEDKDYISEVDVRCTRDADGEWRTDAGSNASLRNAMLGGMIYEIRSLAGL